MTSEELKAKISEAMQDESSSDNLYTYAVDKVMEHFLIFFNTENQQIKYKIKGTDTYVTDDDVADFIRKNDTLLTSFTKTKLNQIARAKANHTAVNPLKDYFLQLEGKWNPNMPSQIDLFLSHFTIREHGDMPEPAFYTKRFYKYMRKYYVASLAQIFGKYTNNEMPIFVGYKKGIGKSNAANFHAFGFDYMSYNQQPMHPLSYYCTKLNAGDLDVKRTGKIFNLLRSCFLINMDEMEGYEKSAVATFKNLIQSPVITDRNGNQYPRLASFIASCNDLTLYENDRRFIVFYIEDIDKSYIEKIDLQMFHAEILYYMNNQQYTIRFTEEDYAEFMRYNERYLYQSDEQNIIKQYFKPVLPHPPRDKLKLGVNVFTTTMVLEILKKHKKTLPKTPKTLGRDLTHLFGEVKIDFYDSNIKNVRKNCYLIETLL